MLKKIAVFMVAAMLSATYLIQAPLLGIKARADVNPGPGQFVTRLYNYALGRNPDTEGYNDWCNKLLYGEANGAQIAAGVLFSEECLNRNIDNSAYVDALYHIFFNRDPDPEGFGAWVNALENGADRRDVMMGFINSVEWANLCASGGFYSGSAAEPAVELQASDDCVNFIKNMYRNFGGSNLSDRSLNELALDLTYLRTTCRKAASDIIFADAFTGVARRSSPGQVVEIFYRAFEDRTPVPAEINAQINAMKGKINLDYLFNYFVNRDAFGRYCVNRGLMPGPAVTVNTAGISDDALASYFTGAAFVGNSVTAGFPTYFSSAGRGLLGNVEIFARVSYSFLSDKNELSGYMLQYDGTEVQAAQLLLMANISKAFICMGTNDLVGAQPDVVSGRYAEYIEGIAAANPGIRIFIVSTPPRCDSDQTPGLTNEKIDELNELMREYCDRNDIDYIDINTPLKNGTEGLYEAYSSDGYVHMNTTGYRIWASTIASYVRSMLASQRHIYRYRGI